MKKMRINIRRFGCFLMSLSLMIAVFMLMTVKAADTRADVVKVGWYEDSYHITGDNGARSGYGYEYEQAVAAYTGWEYEYIKGDWGELLGKLQNGDIDIMAAISYTDERAENMLFSELPMGEEKYYLYADLKNTDISASDLSTLNGKRIVVMEKSVQATQFNDWEEQHNVTTEHIDVDSFERAREMALNHEIDGVISTETPAWVDAGMSAIVTTGGSEIYYAINKNRPDLKTEIDNAMRAMEYDKPFYGDDLYKRYLSAASTPVLSTQEKDWLSQHGDIRIGFLTNESGVSILDTASGKMTGVINDYVIFASDCLGSQALNFELVGFDSIDEQMQALKDGSIDMIFHFSQNPYIAEQNGFALSNTVLTLNMAVVTAKDYFNENASNSVAIEKRNKLLQWYVSYNYPEWDIIECDSDKEVEEMVQSGRADCFINESGQLTKYVDDKKLHSVTLTLPGNTSFAVKRGNTILLSILNKSLKTMSSSMLTGALAMYQNTSQKVTAKDFIKDNLIAVSIALVTTFLLTLTVILVLLKKARIAEAKAKEAQIQAENANAAKSDFLFNMSHDIRTPMNALLGYNRLMKNELTDPKLIGYQEKMEKSGKLLLSIINNVLDMARIESGKSELDENYAEVGNVLEEIYDVFEEDARNKGIKLTYETDVEHIHIMCDETKIKEIFVNLVSNAVKYTSAGGTVSVRIQEIPCNEEGFVRIKTEVADTGIGMSEEYLPHLFDSFTREHNTTTGRVAGTGLGMPIVKKLVDMMGGSIEVESELGKGSRFTVILKHRIADPAYYNYETSDEKGTDVSGKIDSIQGKHILLAEDNDLNAEIAVTILEEMGMTVERVEDGIQCVSRMESQPAGTYDLILMDIQMPNMDGYKATSVIRKFTDKDKADIPIIAMTANAFEEDRKKAISNGMNGHIAKPIDINKLTLLLKHYMK